MLSLSKVKRPSSHCSLRNRWRLALAILVMIVLPALLPAAAPGTALAGATRNLDVVLLIDNSGSMASNDAEGLRWSAAQLFVDLAAPGDRVAAIAFASQVTPLGSAANGTLQTISRPDDRRTLKGYLQRRNPVGATNMQGAISAAIKLLRDAGSANRQVIVFLTDGEPDPPDQRPALEESIRQAGRAGMAVFPILLGTSTDQALADLMVSETGAMRQDVTSAEGLLRAFGRIYAFVQPDRYVDELAIKPADSVSFQTNPGQAITDAVVIVPRNSSSQTALRALHLAGQEVTGRQSLSTGARVGQSEAEHYQLVTVSHNAPLSGEWQVAVGQSSGPGLVIVQSQVVFDLVYPLPSIVDSFVSPRIVPVGKPALIWAGLALAGSRVADAQVSVVSNDQLIALESSGPSPNRDVYWKLVNLGSLQAGEPVVLEIQAGGELAPLRLRKQFAVEAANVPALVVDSPTAADSGLQTGGKARLAVHFEGGNVTQPRVHAYVWEPSATQVIEAELVCVGGKCQDETLSVQPGRAYQVLFVGTASAGGRPYTDAALAHFASGDVIRIDGLEGVRDLGTLTSDLLQPTVALTVTALTREGSPKLTVHLQKLSPTPAKADAHVDAILSPLAPSGANTYAATLTLRGIGTLPPDDYSLELAFESPTAVVSPKSAIISFSLPRPGLTLSRVAPPAELACCPAEFRSRPANLIDYGALYGTGAVAQVDLHFQGAWITQAPGVDVQLTSLHRLGSAQPAVTPLLRAGALEKQGLGSYRLPLTIEIPANMASGRYAGAVTISSPDMLVRPAEYELTFYRPGGLAVVTQKLRPLGCFLADWYALAPPFPRFKGLVGWGLTLLALLCVAAAIYSPYGGGMVVRSADDGDTERLRPGQPVYVIRDASGKPCLSQRAGASQILAEVRLDEPDDMGTRATVRPGASLQGTKVGYFSTRRRAWCIMPAGGLPFRHAGQFAVLIGKRRYEYTLEIP